MFYASRVRKHQIIYFVDALSHGKFGVHSLSGGVFLGCSQITQQPLLNLGWVCIGANSNLGLAELWTKMVLESWPYKKLING